MSICLLMLRGSSCEQLLTQECSTKGFEAWRRVLVLVRTRGVRRLELPTELQLPEPAVKLIADNPVKAKKPKGKEGRDARLLSES